MQESDTLWWDTSDRFQFIKIVKETGVCALDSSSFSRLSMHYYRRHGSMYYSYLLIQSWMGSWERWILIYTRGSWKIYCLSLAAYFNSDLFFIRDCLWNIWVDGHFFLVACNITISARSVATRSGLSWVQIKSQELEGPASCFWRLYSAPGQR